LPWSHEEHHDHREHRRNNQTVASAKARAIQTAVDEGRYRTLLDARVATRQNYDQVEASADTARAELRQAKAEAQVADNEGGYSVLTADGCPSVSWRGGT
jgi:multidrug resistance efflux pump